jgi:XRE family transcriptional regulator, regulator of sulfur utilization
MTMTMTLSRREMVMLLPALAAAQGALRAQGPQAAPLPGKVYHSARIPYAGDDKKKARRFFYGPEQSGYNLEMHETVLGPGTETHPPHTHPHQEIIIVVEGTVEVFVDGKTETVEAGSVIFYEPSKPHSLRNIGATPARYYVVELRGRNA